MMATQFKLPTSTMCIVVWYRNNKRNEVLMPTPQSNRGLAEIMFSKHHVGPSEIRAVKSVDAQDLKLHVAANFGRR